MLESAALLALQEAHEPPGGVQEARPLEQSMMHVAIQEAKDGSVVNWMEHVTDDKYQPE